MISEEIALLIIAPVACLVSYALAGYFAANFKRIGMTGFDVHKLGRPETAEMGGSAVLVAVVLAATLFYSFVGSLPTAVLAALVGVLLVGSIGVIDDMISIKQRYKPFLVAAASLPIALVLFQRSTVTFPLIGPVPFGLLYPLLVVPLSVTTSANFSNMLAGFNGLEAGCAAIAIGTLTFLSASKGQVAGSIIGIFFLAGYLGFLAQNWYPARIFPGDTGTLMAGAAIATIGLVSGIEFAAIVVSIPAALDFALKMLSKNPFAARRMLGDTVVGADGTLRPPDYPALSHAFMRLSHFSEKGLVKAMLGMESVYALLAVALTIGFL